MKYIAIIALTLMFGCASQFEKSIPVAEAIEVDDELDPLRTPGSLWSEGSYVNGIYSAVSIHEPGDVIFVRPSQRLKNRIALLSGEMPMKVVKVDKKAKDKKTKKKKKIQSAPNIIAATVRRKHGRGVLTIQGNRTVFVDGKQKKLRIRGKVREKDLDEKDFVSSDVIFELNVAFAKDKKKKVRKKRKS